MRASKRAVGERQVEGVGVDRRDGGSGLRVEAPAVLQLAVGQVQRHRYRPPHGQPTAALGCTAADLEHPAVHDRSEHGDVGLAQSLGTPDEVEVAEEPPVLALVLVGRVVPPGPRGPPRLVSVDATAHDEPSESPRSGSIDPVTAATVDSACPVGWVAARPRSSGRFPRFAQVSFKGSRKGFSARQRPPRARSTRTTRLVPTSPVPTE